MTITNSDDITVVLSGGTTNINPNNSLGGDPSATPVSTATLNNLFDDVSAEETDDGHEDYRCIYFFNDGDTPIYVVQMWISDDFEGGATVEIGTVYRDESQRITLSNGPITSGSMRLVYDDSTFDSTCQSDLGDWATELEDTLNSFVDTEDRPILQDVSVTASSIATDTIIFDVNFIGRDGKRNHPIIQVVQNNFLPDVVTITITVPQEGAPINTIATEIGLETTPPGQVGFFAASQISPLDFPRLDPTDGVPVWIKRTTSSGITPKERDGFELRFSAQTLEPVSS